MSKRKHIRGEHEAKVDMTPMIDLTFLLVMFFVLTSSFTSLNLEDVLLPVALGAVDQGEESVLIINVTKTDDKTRDGKIIFNGVEQTHETLKAALKLEVDVDAGVRGMEPSPVPNGQPLSKLEVLIRADQGVKSAFLRHVFMACQQVGIYKLKLSALKE